MINDTVVVIAAHPDDEVLGCGGTIARMANEGREVHILLLADGESSRAEFDSKNAECDRLVLRNNAMDRANLLLGSTSVKNLGLSDNRLDQHNLLDIVKPIENFLDAYRPHTVFTHHAGDVNIDHRIAHDAVITACRPQPGFYVKELFFFEVPSSTEWRPSSSGPMFNPNYYYDISDTLNIKKQALHAYNSEMRAFPHPRSAKAVEALAHWRGASVGFEAAEAFIVGRKLI